jgi:YHS domain-containing protein
MLVKGKFVMTQVKDPVCGMMVDSETTKLKSEYNGQTYYFCAPGCKTAFEKAPEKYVSQGHSSHEHHTHQPGHLYRRG